LTVAISVREWGGAYDCTIEI